MIFLLNLTKFILVLTSKVLHTVIFPIKKCLALGYTRISHM